MKRSLIAVSAAGAFLLAGTPAAFADPPHCPPGLAKQGRCDQSPHHNRYDRDDRRSDSRLFFEEYRDRDRAEDAYRAGYEDGRRDGFRAGQRLPDGARYVVIRDYDRYGLRPPRDGYYYAEVDGEILLIQAATQLIAQALGAY